MSQKHRLSPSKQISISIVEMIKNENPISQLSAIRLSLEQQYYQDFIAELKKYPGKRNPLLDAGVKKELKDLEFSNLVFRDLDSEFIWAKQILNKNINEIKFFLTLSTQFTSNLLLNNFDIAKQTLDTIEATFGQSLWLIKNRIALLQLTEGLESQKTYVQNVKEELKSWGLAKFVIHWVSVRNESQSSVSKFITQAEAVINKINPILSPGYQEYCKYHILGKNTFTVLEGIQILRLEYSRSLIDYYEAFVFLLQICSIDNSSILENRIKMFLLNDGAKFEDERIEFLISLFQRSIILKQNDLIKPYDLFLKGDYETAYSLAINELKKKTNECLYLVIAAHCLAMSSVLQKSVSKDNFLDHLLSSLASIIGNGLVAATKELNDVSKIVLNFNCAPWASASSLLIINEGNMFSHLDIDSCFYALKIARYHPYLLNCFDKAERISNGYYSKCNELYGFSSSFYFYSKTDNFDINNFLSIDASNLLNGILSFSKKEYEAAIKYGQNLYDSELEYFSRRGIGLVSYSHLFVRNLKEMCITIVDAYLADWTLYNFLPLKEIYDVVKPGTAEWREVCVLIDLSIVFDIFAKYFDKTAEINRRFAYEDFLVENNLDRPSQLIGIFEKFDRNKLIYYLKNICIESIMDTSLSFQGGSIEVVKERLAVCRILSQFDSSNEDEYRQEIKGLVRKIVIADRKQEVDQSRIFVDIESIKKWATKEIKESYDRYIEYLKFGLGNKIKKEKINESIVPNTITIPENEVNALLRYMIEEITEAFIGADYGLDRFLSTRIRHGILEGHLRRPVEYHNLITKKESKNGPYLPNKFWLDRLNSKDSQIKEYNKAFSKFSEQYDNLLNHIINDWLQVQKANKPQGRFGFIISENDVIKIGKHVTSETTFKEFIDLVISALEETLLLNLVNLRQELNQVSKQSAKKLLNELHARTQIIQSAISVELQNSISQARTDLQLQFDKLIEWFVPPTSGNSIPFTIEDAMMVAEAIVQEGNLKLKLKIDGESEFLIHGQLPIFVDIFINIFENITKRCGLIEPTAEIEIWTDKSSPDLNIIHFKVKNKISVEMDLDLINQDLNRKKALLENGNYNQYLASEGNSGLFKIHKSIMNLRAIGSDVLSTMDFGIEKDQFQIIISVPFTMFNLENEESNEDSIGGR